jgi:hypothetical protein
MNDELNVIVHTREEAHQAVSFAYSLAQALIRDEKPVRIRAYEDEDDITIKQRAFLHAAVFPQISEQYTFPDGTRYTADVWKEFFRNRFLSDKWELRKAMRWDSKTGAMVQAKRKTPHRIRVSTESLGIKAYSQYIDRLIDTAVLELGVVFEFRASEREGVRYVAKPRAKRAAAEEVAA